MASCGEVGDALGKLRARFDALSEELDDILSGYEDALPPDANQKARDFVESLRGRLHAAMTVEATKDPPEQG